MSHSIDRAGRVVIPAEIRRALRLDPGTPLRIFERDGCVVIEPVSPPMRLVRRGRGLVAEVEGRVPDLTADEVRAILERVRR